MDENDAEELKRGAELLEKQLNSIRKRYQLSEEQVAELGQKLDIDELVTMKTAKSISEKLGSKNLLNGILELMNWVIERDLRVMEQCVERLVEINAEIGRLRDEIERLNREIAQFKKPAA